MLDPGAAQKALQVFNLPESQRRLWTSYPDLLGAMHSALDAYPQATLTAEDEALHGEF